MSWRSFVEEAICRRGHLSRRPFVEEEAVCRGGRWFTRRLFVNKEVVLFVAGRSSWQEQNQRPIVQRKLDCLESDRGEGQILSISLNLWHSKIEARAWVELQAAAKNSPD